MEKHIICLFKYLLVILYIWVYIYQTLWHKQDVTQVQFLLELKKLEFRVLFLPDWLPYQD